MIDLDSWQEIFATLRKNRLRTWLTGLGVFLGIVILLVMLGFGAGLEQGVKKNMAGFATNAVFAWGQRTSVPFAGMPANRPIQFDNRDVEALRRLDSIEHLAPRNQLGGFRGGFNVKYKGETASAQVSGDYPAFAKVQEPVMKAGRFIDDHDILERRKVAVIGTGVMEELFPRGADPMGEYIEVSGVYFRVIGVFGTRQTGQNADRTLSTIHVPFTTFQQAFHFGDKVGWFAITGKPGVDAIELEKEVKTLLSANHKIAAEDDMAIGSWNAGKEFGKMNSLFLAINLVLGFAGIMTLAAGVVGVSNIMLISVRERTKELGVRKALGATPWAIVKMIVSESVVLTAIAGYLGLVAAVAGFEAFNTWILPKLGSDIPLGPLSVSLEVAAGSGLILVVFGALAGVIPAFHAAKIQPVEALRTE
jgi:putative ABC transport system permease protein